MKHISLMAASLLLLCGVARADTVEYQFSGIFGPTNGQLATFTLTLPAPLTGTGAIGDTPDQSFLPGANLVCNMCDRIDFFSDAFAHGLTAFPGDAIGYDFAGIEEDFIYYAPGDLVTNGEHPSIITEGRPITVSGIPNATPEPTSASLLAVSLSALALFYVKRRKTSATQKESLR